MGYSEPKTIVSQLKRIQERKLVLPAIQRDFVWSPRQIENLFDSIMRGYPIGSLLSWTVEPETAQKFKFYEVMRQYHQRDNPHCAVLDIARDMPFQAVLDGQQRLTALNIGLRGSYSDRKPGAWRNNPNSYPDRHLYLNLKSKAPENDESREYDFRFLTAEQVAAAQLNEDILWFRVAEVYDRELPSFYETLQVRGIANSAAWAIQLYEAVNKNLMLYFFDEESQDIDRVLDIFVRVNSGGTTLSKSDLLMSIATAQWSERDARAEINDLVDTVNGVGEGFSFNKDTLLKAGLVITDVSDIGFKVRNFNRANMARLEEQWDEVEAALVTAAGLLADFGLSVATLTAHSVLIPIAYYLHNRGLDESYRTSVKFEADRAALKLWTLRSLVKSGIWGSGLDTLLRDLRSVIQKFGGQSFPTAELEVAMAARGKSLKLTDAEIDVLLASRYGRPETFAILAILFPHVNTRNVHHVDHIYPKSDLTPNKLRALGISPVEVEEIVVRRDQLPNLMLLEESTNTSKSAKNPFDWLVRQGDEASRSAWCDRNALPSDLPATPLGFQEFFVGRRSKLEQLLRTRLS